MKQLLISCLFVLVGCAATEDAERPDVSVQEVTSSDDAAEPLTLNRPIEESCSSAGGHCRKSRCGVNEHRAELRCGIDAQCCVPN